MNKEKGHNQIIVNYKGQLNVEVNLPKSQKNIFINLKMQSKAIDFLKVVNSNGVKQKDVTKDQYLIITVEFFLQNLKVKGHKLIAKNGEIYIYNGSYWEKVEYDTIKRVLTRYLYFELVNSIFYNLLIISFLIFKYFVSC